MNKNKITPIALAAALAAGLAASAGSVHAQSQAPAATPAAPAAPAEPTLDVRRYQIDGRLPLSDSEIASVLAPFMGTGKKLSDIEAAGQALEQRMRSQGYAFHRLFVPAQVPQDGVVRLQVVEFKVGTVEVTGNQYFTEQNIRASLPTLKEGDAPEVETLGADVSASNTNPAKHVTVTFRESRAPNSVDAIVRVQDAPPISFIASLIANQWVSGRTPEANVVRATGAFQHSNLFGRDHVMTLSYTTDPRHLSDVSLFGAYYQIPLYGTGMTASGYYTKSDVNSGRVQQGAGFFDVSGSGRFYGARLTKAMRRFGTLQPTVSVALDERIFENTTTFNGAQIQPNVGSRALTLQAGLRDEPAWGVWSASIEHSRNIGGGTNNADINHALNGGEKNWRIWRYNADVTVPLLDWTLVGRVRHQYSGNFLISGEQFGLGGYNSVRGFTDRAVAGERGTQWNVEATGPAMFLGLRPVVFTDGGRVHSRASGLTDTIGAVGVGVRYIKPGWQVAVDVAKVIDDVAGAPPGSKPVRLNLGVLTRF